VKTTHHKKSRHPASPLLRVVVAAKRERSGGAGKPRELAELRVRLAETEETLRAIRAGEVDAVVIAGKQGPQVFTLEGAEQAYRMLIECMNEGALTLTVDKTILYANQCFARMVKCPLEQVMGSSLSRFLSPEDGATLRPLLKQADQSGSKLQVLLHASDGSRTPTQISIRPLASNGSSRETFGMVLTDMTEVRRNEGMLRASNKELESFCYSVAHDLRTPLRSIVSFSQLLEKTLQDGLAPEAKSYLQHTIDSAKQMTVLIDSLLNLSRVVRKEMKREKVDLSSAAQAIAAELKKHQPDRQIDFHIASGLTADGDLELLKLVLRSLFDNAWKFTGRIPHAVIDFNKTLKDGREVFFVRDNGVGFDMKVADKLFSLFQRLHDEKDFPGTGMGLATVQRIVQRNGGEIWADSKMNRGTTFYFTLNGH